LVQGKRNLFDNVVNVDASEDVVGVSKRLAEVLAEDLAGPAEERGTTAPTDQMSPAEESMALPESRSAEPPGDSAKPAATGSGIADEVRGCIVDLQRDFGPRIERILGAKGGLLVVLDSVDDADDERATAISQQIPIALIDRRTLKGLQRLGAASPAADAEDLYEAPQLPAALANPLERRARQKLEAAEVLLRQDCPTPAGELLLGALLSAAALRCGLDDPPELSRVAVWLYADALPSGKLDQDDAMLIMRALTLAQVEDQLPTDLLAALAADAARFVEDAADGARGGTSDGT